MIVELAHPGFLWLLAIPALLVPFALRRSLTDQTTRQKFATTAVRCAVLSCLALALAGVRWSGEEEGLAVLFVVDDSASLSDSARADARAFVDDSLKHRAADDVAGLIGFAESAEVWHAPDNRMRRDGPWPAMAGRAGTATGSALELAAALLPADRVRRVVLVGDGNDTQGRASDAAARLQAAGIRVDAVPVTNPFRPEVLAGALDVPVVLRVGEPFDLLAPIDSNVATPAIARLYRNQFLVEERAVDLRPGRTPLVFGNLKPDPSFTVFEVEIVADQDTVPENNLARAVAVSSGEPRVLLVDADEKLTGPLAAALRAGQIDVTTRPPAGLPSSLEELQRFDLFILGDVPAAQVGTVRMELIRNWVRDFGGGFLLLGGENSFGAGGYYRTAIEDLLPVRMEHQDRQDTPVVALLVVLDRSGSMAAQTPGGRTKMSLANQGAAHAMNVLKPRDYFGVLAVDTRVHPVVELAQLGAKAALEERILNIASSGGGIYVYTALAESFRALRETDARTKHVILFADAADAEEKVAGEMGGGTPGGGTALELAAAMLASRITTSVVALGQETDRDTAFLKLLAERGGGRFYLTNDPLNLPQIFTAETVKVAQSSLVEEPFFAVPAMPSPMLEGIDWTGAPLLLGYNSVKPKPGAEVHLVTEFGEPLLASVRQGLGRAGAFTSDAKNRWAAEWLAWDGFGKFWAQTARAFLRSEGARPFEFAVKAEDGTLRITLDALTADGGFRNELPAQILATDRQGRKAHAAAQQIAPGRYEASLELPESGSDATWIVSLSTGMPEEEPVSFGFTGRYPVEYATLVTDEEALRELASSGGGIFSPTAEQVFARDGTTALRRRDLTPWLLGAALILFPLDIWLRRRTFSA